MNNNMIEVAAKSNMIEVATKYGEQWTLWVSHERYEIVNLGDDEVRRFYMIEPGEYGQPVIVAEPDLAFEAPSSLTYVNAKGEAMVPSERIAGIICKDGPRFSLSNARAQDVVVRLNNDGSVQVGEEVWWIATLFSKDKNRFIGYDAYLRRDRPDAVRILELGDLDLF